MTDTAKPTFPPMPEGPPRQPGPIKVKMLRFARQGTGQGCPLGAPFPDNPMNLPAGKRAGSGDYDELLIQYEPWHRQYRVRAMANRGDAAVMIGERCIPESWAIYEPELV